MRRNAAAHAPRTCTQAAHEAQLGEVQQVAHVGLVPQRGESRQDVDLRGQHQRVPSGVRGVGAATAPASQRTLVSTPRATLLKVGGCRRAPGRVSPLALRSSDAAAAAGAIMTPEPRRLGVPYWRRGPRAGRHRLAPAARGVCRDEDTRRTRP